MPVRHYGPAYVHQSFYTVIRTANDTKFCVYPADFHARQELANRDCLFEGDITLTSRGAAKREYMGKD